VDDKAADRAASAPYRRLPPALDAVAPAKQQSRDPSVAERFGQCAAGERAGQPCALTDGPPPLAADVERHRAPGMNDADSESNHTTLAVRSPDAEAMQP
jgi:hypothetical protein